MHLPHIFHLPPLPPELDWLPPLLGIAVLLLLLRMAVRGTCRLCLLGILILLALAAFPHRDLTLFALGGLAVWCLMPGRDLPLGRFGIPDAPYRPCASFMAV